MRSASLNPYRDWLGIATELRTVNHYQLLGLARFTSDEDVIEAAAAERIAHVQRFLSGENAPQAARLLNELRFARQCLTNAASKAAYDRRLRGQRSPQPRWSYLDSPSVKPPTHPRPLPQYESGLHDTSPFPLQTTITPETSLAKKPCRSYWSSLGLKLASYAAGLGAVNLLAHWLVMG